MRPAVQARTGRDWGRVRLAAVAGVFGVLWLALWGRAFQVQVLMGPRLSEMASRQHEVAESVRGERGRILDRNGRELAVSVRAPSVYARPLEIEDPAAAARALAEALGERTPNVLAKLAGRTNFVWLERQIGDRAAARVAELKLPGVYLVDEYRRLYPGGHLAGQLLGFVGVDGEGLEGMEKSFDAHLAGRTVRQAVSRDASGKRLDLDAESPEEVAARLRGADLRLTVDAHIQSLAEMALARAVTEAGGRWGGCLVVKVDDGDILALAQYPFFNPNVYAEQTPAVWKNRLAGDAFEPGSTLKSLTVAAALQEKVVNPESVFFCENGSWRIRGATIGDTHKYADLPVHKILRYSSNIGTGKIGLELGAERLHDYLDRLGLGQRLDLPLAGENRGMLRPAKKWTQVDLVTASFGQGVSANMLQMARAYLALAREGKRAGLALTLDPAPEREEVEQVFDPRVASQVLSMLREVVQEDGTGTRARIEGLEVGGKTGTAQKASPTGGYGDKYVGSFVAFVPAMAPRYMIMVSVDEPHPNHYGGVVAAPAVREVAMGALSFLGELPDGPRARGAAEVQNAKLDEAPGGELVAREVAAVEAAARVQGGAVPNLVGMPLRRAVEILAGNGTVPVVKGSGLVVARQSPGGGNPWPASGKPVVLWLGGGRDRS
ncbi:MAG: penicillin-binding transpeptidase domain-containing protein [Thermodesulfobacteriota bacterium]